MSNQTPLPWKQTLSKNKKHYIIMHENTIIVKDISTLGDALYIEEACNNYPKAVELLKSLGALTGSEVHNFLIEHNLIR